MSEKPLLRQLIEKSSCLCRLQLHPNEYRTFGLGRRDTPVTAALDFLPGRVYWDAVQPTLNDPSMSRVLGNKAWFASHCALKGLPAPPVVALVDGQGWVEPTDGSNTPPGYSLSQFLAARGLDDVVLKPLEGWKGEGVVRVWRDGAGTEFKAVGRDGQERDLDSSGQWRHSLRDCFVGHSGALLVQRRAPQHDFLEALAPGGASTLRIMTLRARSGEVFVPFGLLRLSRAGAAADNLAAGGILVEIDVESGVLGRGKIRYVDLHPVREFHPDTQRRFAGETFPLWTACLDLARSAAVTVPGVNIIGWDVLLTPDGPTLIEGNHDAGPGLQPPGYGLLRPEMRAVLATWGLEFPTTMPSLTLEGVWRGLQLVLARH